MLNKDLLRYLCCLKCGGDLIERDNFLICKKCGGKYEVIDNNIVKIIPDLIQDSELSIKKWDESYQRQLENSSYQKKRDDYFRDYYEDTYQQLIEFKRIDTNSIYLEIGCGPMFLGQEIAKRAKLVIGVDFSPTALKLANKMFREQGIKNYLLILADIQQLPLKEGSINLIYGGGVVEHFKDTQKCVNELYRVLKPNGVSFNTVPYLNIGALTYRQIWGNIPNFPVLKQLAEFVHIKLLKSKHMMFGYEFSFFGSTLKKIHKKAGFKKVRVDKFKVKLVFDFAPKTLRHLLVKIANSSKLFWPMVKVIGKKMTSLKT